MRLGCHFYKEVTLKAAVGTVIALTFLSPPLLAQQARWEADVVEASRAWSAAFYRGDGNTMESLEVADLVLVMPNGEIWSKSEPRAETSEPQDVESHTKEYTNVRFQEGVALVTGRLIVVMGDRYTMAFTETWVRDGNQWRVTLAQWTGVSN